MAATEANGVAGSDRIEPVEYKDGYTVGSGDFVFRKIGEPVPLKPSGAEFNLAHPPLQALAVSEPFRLLFLAHSQGFYVVRTKDAIEVAKRAKEEGKGAASIEEISVLDVSIGQVSILALSKDSSLLAACVGSAVHVFSIAALLNKNREPSFSCSVPDSSHVKDMKWQKNIQNSFVVLSTLGKLYYRERGSSLKDLLDDVDAVDWSVKGDYLVIARNSTLSFLSSKMKERFHMALSFESMIDFTDSKSVKVDSIKWVRDDSIIIGCLITEDGNEEGYMVQVIITENCRIIEDSCKPKVLSFCELFAAIVDEMLPCRSGPYMLINYLERWELALAANRKNTDQHIISLGWSLGDNQGEAVAVDFRQDKDIPRIELTESGDDNLILGFGIDEVSLYEKIEVRISGGERQELSPYCILLCLSSDGKLVMFHVARFSDPDIPLRGRSSDTCDVAGVNKDSTVVSSERMLSDRSTKNDGGDTVKCQLKQISTETPPQLNDLEQPRILLGQLSSAMTRSHHTQGNSVSFTKQVQAAYVDQPGVAGDAGESACKPVDRASNSKQLVLGETHNIAGVSKGLVGHVPSSTFQSLQSPSQSSGDFLLPKDSSAKVSISCPIQGGTCSNLQQSSDNARVSETGTKLAGIIGSNSFQGVKFNSHSFGNAPFTNGLGATSLSYPSSALTKLGATTSLESAKLSALKNEAGKGLAENDGIASSSIRFSSPSFSGSIQNVREKSNSGASNATYDVANQGFQSGSKMFGLKDNNVILTSSSPAKVPNVEEQRVASMGTRVGGFTSAVHSLSTGKVRSSKGNAMPAQYSANKYKEPELSKSFCNVNEMVKEMDSLLSHIEEEGGFRDACTVFQRNFILELEEDLQKLSDRCRNWKIATSEQQRDIQHLQDKTVQVLARKVYVEGIIKQASDKHYWELWDLQKLNPEFELKKQQLEKLHQNLMTQLINLERHFNTIELNKYGESNTHIVGRRMSGRNLDNSRPLQSLHSLYNTMNSQLAAAEQLSECLAKQMATLKIESPPMKQKNVAKELFESIGLTYDVGETYNSPDVKKITSTPDSIKRFTPLLSSINQPSKCFVPETARRRRDSLDKSWTKFEPQRTTVKRMLQEGRPRVRLHKSSFEMTQEIINIKKDDDSAILFSRGYSRSSPVLPPKDHEEIVFENGETGRTTFQPSESSGSYFKWANDQLGPLQSGVPTFSVMGQVPGGHLQASPVSATDRPSIKHSHTGQFNSFAVQPATISQTKQTMLFETAASDQRMSGISDTTPQKEFYLPKHALGMQTQSTESPNTKSIEHVQASRFTTAGGLSSKHFQLDTPTNVAASVKTLVHTSATSSAGTLPVIPSISPSASPMPGNIVSPLLSSALATSSTATVSSSAQTNIPSTTTSTSPFSFSGAFSLQLPKPEVASSGQLISEKVGLTVQPSQSSLAADVVGPKSEANGSVTLATVASDGLFTSQPDSIKGSSGSNSFATLSNVSLSSNAELISKPESTMSVAPPPVLDRNFPGVQRDSYTSSSFSIFGTMASSSTNLLSGTMASQAMSPTLALSNKAEAKNDGSDLAISQEDDMEEEAPDPELGLGALGGFGLGSAPAASAPNNPFGGPFAIAATNSSSSQVPLTVPNGEFFRPPSFSLPSLSPQPSQPMSQGVSSGGFGVNAATQSGFSGFGKPAQIGGGQQALGSVLGAFGQSRQLGTGLPGAGVASSSSFGGGGFSSAATGGGFASLASSAGGFAALATGGGGGGFGAAASPGGGFAAAASGGRGFAVAAAPGGGFAGSVGSVPPPTAGGFGAFGNRPGGGGFSAFGGSNSMATGMPERFTQIRK